MEPSRDLFCGALMTEITHGVLKLWGIFGGKSHVSLEFKIGRFLQQWPHLAIIRPHFVLLQRLPSD